MGTSRRLGLMAAIVLLHIVCYWIVTRITAARGPGALFDTTLAADRLVPYLPATWPLYWMAYPFVLFAAGAALTRLPDPAFCRAVAALAGMTVMGAVIQMLLPARAPWPAVPTLVQRRYHESALILPYATLPSMHVAYCTVAAGLLSAARPGPWPRVGGVLVVALVLLSTLTLKEHVVLDAITGLVLALGTLAWWRQGVG
jgi:PAP2 superfamily protein